MEDRTVKTPYDGDGGSGAQLLLAAAWKKGHAARCARKPPTCPLSNYPSPAVPRAWLEGWRAAHEELEIERIARLENRVPDVRSQKPPIRPR